MKPWRAIAVAIMWGMAWKTAAQEPGPKITASPTTEDKIMASPGDVIWTTQMSGPYRATAHIVLDMPAQGSSLFAASGDIDLPAGSLLDEVPIRTGLRACARVGTSNGSQTSRPCLIDINADGQFDLFSPSETSDVAPLASQASYHWENDDHLSEGGSATLSVTYLGVKDGSLLLIYQEVFLDAAQPKYSEKVSIPVVRNLPQIIRFKRVALNVLSIDDEKLRYSVVRSSHGGIH